MNPSPQQRLIESMVYIGAPESIVKCIVALDLHGPLSSKKIQDTCNLRQPEVSLTIKNLSERGMVKINVPVTKGRGRPSHRYELNNPIQECLEGYIAEAKEREKQIRSHIEITERILDDLLR